VQNYVILAHELKKELQVLLNSLNIIAHIVEQFF